MSSSSAQRAEPRGLRVDRLAGPLLDVGERVQRRVPGDPVVEGSQHLAGLVVDVGVLEVGVGEALGDRAVELRVGVDIHGGAHVHPLQVEHPHRGEPGDLLDQPRVPVVLGVELELELRVAGEPVGDRLGRGPGLLVAEAGEAGRADEAKRLRVALDHLPEGEPSLAQGQVEGRRLVGPAAIVARRRVLGRRGGEQVERADQLACRTEGGRGGQVEDRPRVAMGDVIEGGVDDVLADPLLTLAVQVDDRRRAREVAELAVVGGQLIALDPQRQFGEPVVDDAHRAPG